MQALKTHLDCRKFSDCDNIIRIRSLSLKMGSVTSVLNNASLRAALKDKRLQSLLYQELRIIAHAKLKTHHNNSDLDTTSLVHEAYLKLNVNSADKQWSNRRHFYAAAALSMRQILVDVARRRLAEKRGSQKQHLEIDEGAIKIAEECRQVVALNEALDQLNEVDSGLVEVVNLRYFVGMTVAETAEILDVSKRTVDRTWQKAKALLMAWIDE